MDQAFSDRWGQVSRNSDIILAAIVVALLTLLVVPLTDLLIDTLISISIVLAVTTFLVTMYSRETLAFSSFPSFLLLLTLFRLCLNIATTRMILTEAHAGEIISTFGNVVTGGNPFAGFVIFILITGVNFAVITKGSGRVAEVAARFMLDSLPGKQLAIDADVSAGLINEEEAKRRRDEVMKEADFYGAMDGASKFVRGDAIAGIAIILVNLIGGFTIGFAMKEMTWSQVVHTYFTLTIGDGLVTQIPALLVSVAAGIIITRSSSNENLAESFQKQLFSNPRVLYITGGMLLFLGMIPGMPFLVTTPIAAALIFYAYQVSSAVQPSQETVEASIGFGRGSRLKGRKLDELEQLLIVDPLELEIGQSLNVFVNEGSRSNIFERISHIRRQIANELGLVVPSIRVHDNLALKGDEYLIKIKGIEAGNGVIETGKLLAMHPSSGNSPGSQTDAFWINPAEKDEAAARGYVILDPLTVLTTHLYEVIRSHAAELLNRQEVSKLVENAREESSAVINELIPAKLTIGSLLRVLQNLLQEKVSIRDMVTILETLADHADETRDPDKLTEYVRQSLARSIVKPYLSDEKALYAITLDPKVEQLLAESLQQTDLSKRIVLHPVTYERIMDQLYDLYCEGMQEGVQPVCLTSAFLRPHLSRLIERSMPKLPVLSINELEGDIPIKPIGTVSTEVFMH